MLAPHVAHGGNNAPLGLAAAMIAAAAVGAPRQEGTLRGGIAAIAASNAAKGTKVIPSVEYTLVVQYTLNKIITKPAVL